MQPTLEIIGFNIESCRVAQAAGANRIELCANAPEGGTTPSYGFIKAARQILSVELYVMIRPRGGDFLYSDAEFQIMKTDVALCKALGCDGIVTGLLSADGSVDTARCRQLVELAYPMSVTFHRAFDRVSHPFKALEDIIATGCERILTSGQKPTAIEGADMIKRLIEQADERIIIMPGSGVRADNIAAIASQTNAVEFHTSARKFDESKMDFINDAMNEDLNSITVDELEVRRMAELLNTLQH